MASISLPVNIAKLLASQQTALIAHVDTKTTETKSHVTTKATDTKNTVLTAVNDETQAIDNTLEAMTVVDGQLDGNVTAINANMDAKIATLITGAPINAVMPLQVGGVAKYVAPNGAEWLKSGWAETDFAGYPDADHSLIVPKHSFDVSSYDLSAYGCCMDDTHFYIVGYGADSVHKFLRSTAAFVQSYSVSAQDSSPKDIAWDGVNFWLLGASSNRIHKYSASWAYTGEEIVAVSKEGLTFDSANNTLWTLSNDGILNEWGVDRVSTGRSLNFGGVNNFGVGHDGVDFYICTHNMAYLRKFKGDLSSTSEVFECRIDVYTSNLKGIEFDSLSRDVLTVSSSTKLVELLVESIGIPEAFDTDTGLSIYARIK
jgi:hypothetical protein